jgi:hypothetical protein
VHIGPVCGEMQRAFWGKLGAHAIVALDAMVNTGLSRAAAPAVIKAIYWVDGPRAERLVDHYWAMPSPERLAMAEAAKAGLVTV